MSSNGSHSKKSATTNKSDHCEIVVLLDRSGSMAAIRTDMEGGYDSFIRGQRELPGECAVTLVQFDSHGIDTVYESRPIATVPSLALEPRGSTPLLDAMGQTLIRSIARKIEGRVLFLVITDGHENASHEFSRAQIKTLVEAQTAAGWAFSFLGANVDAFAEAHSFGVSKRAAADFDADSDGVHASFAAVSEATVGFRGGAVYEIAEEHRSKMKKKRD